MTPTELPGPRLRALADYVTGSCVMDVGTDHAYLPVYLAQNGFTGRLIATDVVPGPVESARRTVAAAGLCDRIKVRMADGLAEAELFSPDTVIIAGMGGHLIASILEAAPSVKRDSCRLILQPMTKAADLRRYLCENGFTVTEDALVGEGDRIYQFLVASYGGTPRPVPEPYYTIGLCPEPELSPLRERFLRWQYRLASVRLNGHRARGEEAPEEEALMREIERILHDNGRSTV